MEKNLVNIIKEAGIVGAGGAGFPTHVKIDTNCDYVIVNAAECEPLVRVDQQLMEYKSEEILNALNMVVRHTGAKKGIVGIKAKYKGAVHALRKIIKKYPKISIHELGNFYPAGDEQVLVYEILGKIVPEGGIPLGVGTVVLNSETLLNIYNAAEKNLPVTEKYVTVAGEVKNPITLKVPIGVKIKELIGIAGGSQVEDFVVVEGGPMMGKVVEDMDTPITKTTKALIVLERNHPVVVSIEKSLHMTIQQAKTACMHCNLCSEVCPRRLIGHSLEPHKLIRIASYGSTLDKTTPVTTAFLCCDCRLCEYACIMDLQPWKVNIALKKKLSEKGIGYVDKKSNLTANEFRNFQRYPLGKLIMQLGIDKYDVKAPLADKKYEFPSVELLLKQHIGATTTSIVSIGDRVTKGQLIAKLPNGKLGANLYSSIDGVVKLVDENKIVIFRV